MYIYDLKCEYMSQPYGVVDPRFFWKYESESAENEFVLSIASSKQKLAQPDVYQAVTKNSLYIHPSVEYEDLHRYYWTVSSGTVKERASFITGIRNWNAGFFTYDPRHKSANGSYIVYSAEFFNNFPEDCIIAICTRGYHRLTVNGVALSDTFAPNRSNIKDGRLFCRVYDLSGIAIKGKNTVQVFCDDGWCRKCDAEPCISSTVRTGDDLINITGWRYGYTNDGCTGDYSWGNFGGEHLTDKLEISGDFEAVRVDADFSISNDIAPTDRILRTVTAQSVRCENGKYIFDMGRCLTGYLDVCLNGVSGETAILTVSDKQDCDCSFNQVYELEFAGGNGNFKSMFNWMSGRYLCLSNVSYCPELACIKCREVSNLDLPNGIFEVRDQRLDYLNGIIKLDIDTFISNTVSGVTMDCPHRERLGYGETGCSTTWGVGVPYFDSAGFYNGYLRVWATVQRGDGSFPHVAPDFWGGGGTQWSNYCLVGTADVYAKFRDERLREEMLPHLEKWIDFLHSKCSNGLLTRYELQEWDFLGDWATPDGDDWGNGRQAWYFNNCCYAYALLRISELVTRRELKAKYSLWHTELAEAINKEFLDNGIYCAPHARYQAIAIISGVAENTERTYRVMLDIIRRKGYIDGGSAGLSLMLRALGNKKEGIEAVLEWLGRRECPSYRYFLDHGQTNIPEMWDMRDAYGGSRMHTCYSGISGFFMRYVAGISYGDDSVIISPYFSDEFCNYQAREQTLYGEIRVDVKRKNDTAIIEITVPCGCLARFVHENEDVALKSGYNCFEFNIRS